MRNKAVIFDLDGTLLDTLVDIADAMNAVLKKYQYPVHELHNYKYFVGAGIRDMVIDVLPESQCQEPIIQQCFEAMKKEYSQRWNNKSCPYDGIPAVLDYLAERKIPTAIHTNKPHEQAVLMIHHLLSNWSFSEVEGAKKDRPLKPDPQVALAIAKSLGVEPKNCLFVGDTDVDMKTAKAAGMFAVGVLWGLREKQELVNNGADLIISHPLELIEYLENR